VVAHGVDNGDGLECAKPPCPKRVELPPGTGAEACIKRCATTGLFWCVSLRAVAFAEAKSSDLNRMRSYLILRRTVPQGLTS